MGFIEIVADDVLSILGNKANAELAHRRRKAAYILMAVFFLIVFGMAVYVIFSMSRMILNK
jgi:heme/copper-type cytochrome/quinol oxidase subunit 2